MTSDERMSDAVRADVSGDVCLPEVFEQARAPGGM